MLIADTVGTARNIRRLMSDRNVGVSGIVQELRIHRATVYAWMNGNVIPNVNHCVALCNLLGCSLDDLVEKKEEEW